MMGIHKKWTKPVIEKIRVQFELYIEATDIPIVSEFAYQNNISRQRLYEFAENGELFSDTIKKCITKKEAQLEKLGLLSVINPSMAIFSLKQLGWKDKQEVEMSGGLDNTVTIKIDGEELD